MVETADFQLLLLRFDSGPTPLFLAPSYPRCPSGRHPPSRPAARASAYRHRSSLLASVGRVGPMGEPADSLADTCSPLRPINGGFPESFLIRPNWFCWTLRSKNLFSVILTGCLSLTTDVWTCARQRTWTFARQCRPTSTWCRPTRMQRPSGTPEGGRRHGRRRCV